MTAKEVVKQFYALDFAKDKTVLEFIHPECQLNWNSSKGYMSLDYKGIQEKIIGIKESFLTFNYKLSHLLEDNNTVTARYTIYGTPIEQDSEDNNEEAIAHFISIWEVKEGKLYRGYEISQLLDDKAENISTFSEINI